MSVLFGITILIISIAYWKFDSTEAAKAMFIPLLIISLLASGIGYYLIDANSRRIINFQEQYTENRTEFIHAEKERTEWFIKWYPYSQYAMFGIMIAGMLCMILTHKPLVRAIGIALMLFVFCTFVLDHFSEERANTYHKHIINSI